jgi:hypothetical protein
MAGDCAARLALRFQIPEVRRPRDYHEFKCFHESGHCVAWSIFGLEVFSVSVGEGAGGVTELWKSQAGASEAGTIPSDEKQQDSLQKFFDVELDKERLRLATWLLMIRHWGKVERLARELIIKRSLDQGQIAQILKPTIKQ